MRRILAYREALRSRVLAGHRPILAPVLARTSPNLMRSLTIRANVPRDRRLASGGANAEADEPGEAERADATLVTAVDRTSTIRASAPRGSVIAGRTGGPGSRRGSNVGVADLERRNLERR